MKNSKIYPWVVVGLLWGVALLNYMDRQMLSTMRDAMAVDITELQSAANFGRLMGVFLWIYGCMSPIAGMVGDRMNRKWLIVGSLFVWSAVTYLMGIADTYNEVFFLRALMGISEALYIPAGLSLIADYHSDKSRSLAIGIHMTGLYTGQAIGGFGATVAAAFSWHTTFHWFGIAGIAYAVILMLFLHEKKDRIQIEQINSPSGKEKSNLLKGLSLLFSNIAFWVILLYFAAPSLPGWATKNWLPTLFAENLNIPMSQAGPMSTITIALSSFIGVIIGGTLSDKWVQKKYKRTCVHGCHRLGTYYSIPAFTRVRTQFRSCCGSWIIIRNRLWYLRCQQYADSMPVRIIQTPCYRLWYHEYDRRVCGSSHYRSLGKVDRRR